MQIYRIMKIHAGGGKIKLEWLDSITQRIGTVVAELKSGSSF